jgi:hypothetical protein
MRRLILGPLVVLATLLVLPQTHATAAPPQSMQFRNNLLPGHLTIHRITRTVTRKAKRKSLTERLTYGQQTRWVQCNIGEPKPGSVMCYQMIVDQPPKVESLKRGKKPVEPAPKAADFGLVQPTPALCSAYRTPQDSPPQVPMTDPAQRAVLSVLLDYAHWPKNKIDAGHKWERDLHGGGITGKQTFEFIDMEEGNRGAVARVTLYVEGKFEDPLSKEYEFGKGQAILYWSRLERTLVRMEAQADYIRKRENSPEEYKLKLTLDLTKLEMLSEQAQDTVIDQMLAFEKAQKAQRDGRYPEARDLCREYRQKWPDAVWMPVVEELERRTVEKKSAGSASLTTEELDALLVKTLLAYEAAIKSYEYDLAERARGRLGQLADENHGKLVKLAQDEDPHKRGRAVFALVFGSRTEDLRAVEKAVRDPVASVRAMALAALAARRDPETSQELPVVMLDDPEAQVRIRACEAVAACLSPEHFSVAKAAEKLDKLMREDGEAAVRIAAVRALAAIGSVADVPKIEEASAKESDEQVRKEMEKALGRLRAKGG